MIRRVITVHMVIRRKQQVVPVNDVNQSPFHPAEADTGRERLGGGNWVLLAVSLWCSPVFSEPTKFGKNQPGSRVGPGLYSDCLLEHSASLANWQQPRKQACGQFPAAPWRPAGQRRRPVEAGCGCQLCAQSTHTLQYVPPSCVFIAFKIDT